MPNPTTPVLVTLSPNGTRRRTVQIIDIVVPDLWPIIGHLRKTGLQNAADLVEETWSLAHDLKRHIEDQGKDQ